jgi:hypothetical protein
MLRITSLVITFSAAAGQSAKTAMQFYGASTDKGGNGLFNACSDEMSCSSSEIAAQWAYASPDGSTNTPSHYSSFFFGVLKNKNMMKSSDDIHFNVLAGGQKNKLNAKKWGTIVGGGANKVLGNGATIVGGFKNKAKGEWSAIVGGSFNMAMKSHSLAMGYGAKATHINSAAFGFGYPEYGKKPKWGPNCHETDPPTCCATSSEGQLLFCTKNFNIDGELHINNQPLYKYLGYSQPDVSQELTTLKQNLADAAAASQKLKTDLAQAQSNYNTAKDQGPDTCAKQCQNQAVKKYTKMMK